MCLSPVKIPNPRFVKRTGVDAGFLYVNCGHCAECVEQKRADWYVRLCYEFDKFKKLGGCGYFLTLTYNDMCLPYCKTSDFQDLIDEFQIKDNVEFFGPCFNKKHIKQFIKDFRFYLKKMYDLVGMKYFVVTEFGEEKHRPHYHILFFIEKYLPESSLRSLCNYVWSERVKYDDVPADVIRLSETDEVSTRVKHGLFYVSKYWIIAPPSGNGQKKFMFKRRYGFTSWSSRYGALIQSKRCLNYVTKYLLKDTFWGDTPEYLGLNYILEHCLSLVDLEKKYPPTDDVAHPDFVRVQKSIDRLRNCLQFHLQSNGIGSELLFDISSDLDKGLKTLKRNKLNCDATDRLYSIPQYIIRRLFFSVDRQINQNRHYNKWCSRVYLNELGKKCMIDFVDSRIDEFIFNWRLKTSYSYLQMIPQNIVFADCNKKFGFDFYTLFHRLSSLTDVELRIMWYYIHCFRGLSCLVLAQFKDIKKLDFLDFSKDFFIHKVNTSDAKEIDKDGIVSMFDGRLLLVDDLCMIVPQGYDAIDICDIDCLKNCETNIKFWNWFRLTLREYLCEHYTLKKQMSDYYRRSYNNYINNQNF